MKLKDAAENAYKNYLEQGVPHLGLSMTYELAFLAGAGFERERILGMLNSPQASAYEDEKERHCYNVPMGLYPSEWADWLSEKLEEEDVE